MSDLNKLKENILAELNKLSFTNHELTIERFGNIVIEEHEKCIIQLQEEIVASNRVTGEKTK